MKGNVALVGGRSGIGDSLRRRLETEGWQITEASRHSVPELDVTSDDPAFPPCPETLDGLVYCPGTIRLRPFGSLTTKDFQEDLEINLLGAVKAVQFYLPALQKAESASVVLFSTVATRTGMAFHTSVAAAKGALEGFARALARRTRPESAGQRHCPVAHRHATSRSTPSHLEAA